MDKETREKKHNHKLKLINVSAYDGSENEDIAIYWCEICGAIQEDIESDGRFVRHYAIYKPSP
ncbi:MAG: hypothetical protein KKD44_26340 [Proteobacteria bacterium]|nr:hypothetical protein [Pseudomonadota bacterium]